MSSKKAFDRGMFAGILLMLGAQGLYWFITTSAHPDASSLRTALVALQCVVGFGGTLWLLRSRTDGSLHALAGARHQP